MVDLVVSLVAVALLALYMKCAAVAAIAGPHPAELLIWGELPGVVPGGAWDWIKHDRVPAFRIVNCAVLQVLWCVRVIIIPVLAGAGSAVAYASSIDASATVMNSIAITFIFDLDCFLFPLLVSCRNREAFFSRHCNSERHALAAAASDTGLVHRLTWLLWTVDVVSVLDMYAHASFKAHYRGIYDTSLEREMRNYLYVRGATAGLIQLVLVVKRQMTMHPGRPGLAASARELEPGVAQSDSTATQMHLRATAVKGVGCKRPGWRLGLQVLAQVGVILASCFFSFFMAHNVLSAALGYRGKMRHYPDDLVDPSSKAASDAGYAPGNHSFMHYCLSGDISCETLHLYFDWGALNEWACGHEDDCPSQIGLFD